MVIFVFNFWFRKLLNAFEFLGGLFHVVFFIVSLITLVVMGERSSPEFVFKTLTHGVSGWNDPGVCWGLGLLTLTFSVIGKKWPSL